MEPEPPSWILYLTAKGEANFINRVAILAVKVLFQCENSKNETKCGLLQAVGIDMLDESTFKTEFDCPCGNHFRMEEQYPGVRSDSYKIYGNYSLAKTLMIGSDVTWIGDVFGYGVEINTSYKGYWKMDMTEFLKITPSEISYTKKVVSEDDEYAKLNSSSEEEDFEDGPQFRKLKRVRKAGQDKNVVTVGVEGLCPYTVSLKVVARMEEIILASSEESKEEEGPEV